MAERTKIIVAMWLAYAVGIVAVALTKSDEAGTFGFFTALVLGIVTVRLFRKPD